MRIKPLSFDPPRVPIDADLTWLLRSAFATEVGTSMPNDTDRALLIARATQLSGRVAARLGAGRRSAGLDGQPRELSEDYYANVAKEALLMQAQGRIARLAEELKVPVIAVKFGGLRLAGVISVGARAVADLDVLVPKTRARAFWRALLAEGFQRTGTHEYPHQLEALVDPFGAVIDLHLHLPGVIVEKGFATADQLLARGLVTRAGEGMLVPSHGVLAAHAIVHALLQNRSTPQTYSPLRMVSDVLDLRRKEPLVLQNAADCLAPELASTCETLERLCIALEQGSFDAPSFEGTSEQILLWHCLGARLDLAYAERLRAAGLAFKFRDGSSPLQIARYIAELIYPAESALDSLYGPATGIWAHVRRRLLRPLDLAVRAKRRSACWSQR